MTGFKLEQNKGGNRLMNKILYSIYGLSAKFGNYRSLKSQIDYIKIDDKLFTMHDKLINIDDNKKSPILSVLNISIPLFIMRVFIYF